VPVLVEPDPHTFNMDPARAREAITSRTRAILTVHLYGRIGWSPELQAVADAAGVPIVEDAAQSQGAALDGRRAGSLGLATGTSLYPGKNLGALGDAGIVTTWDAPLADAVRTIANYGSQRKYENLYKGVNSRLDELQAAMLLVKLDRLDADNARRREIASRYGAGIRHGAITLPEPGPEGAHVWHQYVVRADDREGLQRHLAAHGVQTLVHYPTPPHRQPAYAEWAHRSYPIAEAVHRTVLSLPMDPTMSDADVDSVVATCNAFRSGR
jgi:dTDP-4-amino-4,6-dideoxygalactose transaminase